MIVTFDSSSMPKRSFGPSSEPGAMSRGLPEPAVASKSAPSSARNRSGDGELRDADAADAARTACKRGGHSAVVGNRRGERIGRNSQIPARRRSARVAQRTVGGARKLAVARKEATTVRIGERKEARTVDCKIERTRAARELSLREENVRAERHRS